MKEKIDAAQEIGVANRVLDGQTAMGLAGLDGRVELLEKQGRFLLDQQEQESNTWHNIAFNLCEEVREGEEKVATLQDLLDIQPRLIDVRIAIDHVTWDAYTRHFKARAYMGYGWR